MKQPTISFRRFGGSGPLSVYWHSGSYGDAVEATSGKGVAWMAPHALLLGVEFDDVRWELDAQSLCVANGDIVLSGHSFHFGRKF